MRLKPKSLKILLLLLGLPLLISAPLQAQQTMGTPRKGVTEGGCKWLVPWGMEYAQPKQLKPGEVTGKNARGCLSQYDANYGEDGCPLKFCNYKEIKPMKFDRITTP
jgi:hypothetical protein